MKLSELEDKRLLLIGMGKEGQATYKFLKKHLKHATIETTDQKDGYDYLKKQANFDLAIKSPGVPPRLVTIPYTTSTNIFFANFNGFTIGITGTKGKSTTTKLTYDILHAAKKPSVLAGNIGIPLLDVLEASNQSGTIAVCELSSYQLEGFEYTPNIAVITNIYNAHVPHHGSWEKYLAAKANIVARADNSTTLIYNPAFAELNEVAKKTKARAIPFEEVAIEQTPQLPGKFNTDNIRAAQTVAHHLKITDTVIKQAINDFKPLPHRLELVGKFRSIRFYDDAASSTPESTIAALETLENVGTLMLGGEDRDYDFASLVKIISDQKIPNLVLFPDTGDVIARLLNPSEHEILKTKSMEDAVAFAYAKTQPGAICLLSTAAPSYTVWKDFAEKGDLFQKYVKELG